MMIQYVKQNRVYAREVKDISMLGRLRKALPDQKRPNENFVVVIKKGNVVDYFIILEQTDIALLTSEVLLQETEVQWMAGEIPELEKICI